MPDIPTKYLVRPGKAAEIIGCSRNTIYNYLQSKYIRGVRTADGTWLVDSRSCQDVPRATVGRPRGGVIST